LTTELKYHGAFGDDVFKEFTSQDGWETYIGLRENIKLPWRLSYYYSLQMVFRKETSSPLLYYDYSQMENSDITPTESGILFGLNVGLSITISEIINLDIGMASFIDGIRAGMPEAPNGNDATSDSRSYQYIILSIKPFISRD